MTQPTRHRLILIALIPLLLPSPAASGQALPLTLNGPPVSVDPVLKASAGWQRRTGAERRVIDQVCLVPDFATFLEAIATWDERHYYPILIDDIELTFKFLRAFQPARIVRYPRRSQGIAEDQVWTRALETVAAAWQTEREGDGEQNAVTLRGDTPPRSLGEPPPSVVLSAPESPMLAGAIALAAGRFQPLLRWDVEKHYTDILSHKDAQKLAAALEETIANCTPSHSAMGDDCDFITLAGDWPYRYQASPESADNNAFDDLIGRTADGQTRWAFTGRLLGNAPESVYRAMCSLFLQPKSALFVNTYDEREKPWGEYVMRGAARRLARLMQVTHRGNDRSNLAGWHQIFDPFNRFGLVMINSHGEPNRFGLTSDTGLAGDVPQTEPAAVLMIHSFSAADPTDPNTIAGRWLANGAFVYFGSMQEPFLSAFRPPELVASRLESGMPLGAAMRRSTFEPFNQPWRLVYLGDPLYRLESPPTPARVAPEAWTTTAAWPRYTTTPRPSADATADTKLHWEVRTAIAALERKPKDQAREHVDEVLLTLQRSQLDAGLKPYFDARLADALLQANRPDELATRLAAIPPEERSPAVTRHLETCRFQMLEHYLNRREFTKAQRVWSDLIRSEQPREILEQITRRMGVLADSVSHRAQWRAMLIAMGRRLKNTPAAEVIENERKRIQDLH